VEMWLSGSDIKSLSLIWEKAIDVVDHRQSA
jgi:hypothetical protein